MPDTSPVVFLFDVDNTLLDNDRVTRDLRRYLIETFGPEEQQLYWHFFEQLRSELGYADYLGALQHYRKSYPRDPNILQVSSFLINYKFANRLFPGSLDTIEHVSQWGPAVVLSDGDAVFQPRKVASSGVGEAVKENILIYIHKEEMLDDVELRYPARHYVMFDDKLRILTAMKQIWGKRLTTVFVKQGHYAADLKAIAQYPPADIELDHIGDGTRLSLEQFTPSVRAGRVGN